jgi:hypothetical protein
MRERIEGPEARSGFFAGRRSPGRGERSQLLKPPTLETIAILQRNGRQRDGITVVTAGGGDGNERPWPRPVWIQRASEVSIARTRGHGAYSIPSQKPRVEASIWASGSWSVILNQGA